MRIRELLLSLVPTIVISAIAFVAYTNLSSTTNTSPQIFITAAHIPSEDMAGYTLMYKDESRDTAYYLKNDYNYHYPEVGEVVYFGDSTGTVVDIAEGKGFYITTKADLYQGLSGSRVKTKDGDEIGFISSVKGDRVLCISIK